MTDDLNNIKVPILESNTHLVVPKASEDVKEGLIHTGTDITDRDSCVIHPDCIHRETCDRSLCYLFFQPGVTWDDLKDAVRKWLEFDNLRTLGRMNYGREGEIPTDIERFVMANLHLFKTPLVYTVMSKVIFIALMEVFDE